ncbi:MAG TPA: CRISPR-associated endonuclease Cas2 [Solirubrobacterales bacterium]|nr:CRISPR-associated endonuclease Cas2 [Solirubrobacterales bacterium]
MAERTRYIVTYDIRTPKRLRKVHGLVTDFGERLQYSVYICDLTKMELIDLRRQLREEIELEEDSVSIFDLGPPAGRLATKVEHLGTEPDLPTTEPEIW